MVGKTGGGNSLPWIGGLSTGMREGVSEREERGKNREERSEKRLDIAVKCCFCFVASALLKD